MDVSKLSTDISSHLRSDPIVRNVSSCVIELVKNALHAKATNIAIRINLETFHLEVVDNGIGMTETQLKSIGERCSSKNYVIESNILNDSIHHGNSIKSISNVSFRLLVVSRPRGEDVTYCKVFSDTGAVVHKAVSRMCEGTTVIVENILGKFPVRQRCIKSYVELQTIKWYIQATALMFPSVNFSIRDDTKGRDIFKIERTKSTASTFMNLFPGAVENRSSMLRLESRHENVTIKAMISSKPCNSDQLQFVFVNKQFMPDCELQNYLNHLYSKIKEPSVWKPIYVVNLSCPREEYYIIDEPEKRRVVFKDWPKIKKCVFNLVKQLVNDDSILEEDKIEGKKKSEFDAKTAFDKLNTAHTVFGKTACRRKAEKPTIHEIDDTSSDSVCSVSLLDETSAERYKAEITNVRLEENKSRFSLSFKLPQKTCHRMKKLPAKLPKSPRLSDQGAVLTYRKKDAKKELDFGNSGKEKAANVSVESQQNECSWLWNFPKKKRALNTDENTDSSKNQSRKETMELRLKNENKNYNNRKLENLHSKPKDLINLRKSSRRQIIRKTCDGRISKKRNNYFDVESSNEKDLISKYGQVKKKFHQEIFDNSNIAKTKSPSFVNSPIKENNTNVEWTAVLTAADDYEGIHPTMIFDPEKSPDLNCLNDSILECQKLDLKTPENKTLELIPTLPFVDDESVKHDGLQLEKITKRLDFNEEISELEPYRSKTFNLYNNGDTKKVNACERDHIINEEIFDSKRKVQEWISKMSPVESTELENERYPATKHSYLTDKITDDLEEKVKLSKTQNNLIISDSKRELLKFDNFLTKSKVQRYMLKSKAHHRQINRTPMFKWNLKARPQRNYDDIVDDPKENNQVQMIPPNAEYLDQKSSSNTQTSKKNANTIHVDNCEANMSIDRAENCDDVMNNILSDTQNIIEASQHSDCSKECLCKCHKKSRSKNEYSNDFRDDRKSSTQHPVKSCRDVEKTLVEVNNVSESNVENCLETIPMEEQSCGEVRSQHFSVQSNVSENNSKYFCARAELAEKLKFKLKSRFLECSSAVDIPKGMLQVQRTNSNLEKLDGDEKKTIEKLVKPYSFQNHITLDDYGNSCIRVFPFLKKNETVENSEEELNCDVVFAKEDISSFKFMAQIENKFILVSAFVGSVDSEVLVLLDQHAIDERIRVEKLLKDYTDGGNWRSTQINPSIHLSIPFNYSTLFTDHQSNFEEFGLFYEFNNVIQNNEERLLVSFVKVPTCFYNKATREKNDFRMVLKQLIESLVKELLKRFTTQETLVHTIPHELQNVVNYEACRGAVKFGDKLSSQLCVALLEGLKSCNLPFQCAHGRPCLAPLVNLGKLKHLQRKVSVSSLEVIRDMLQ